MHTVFLHSFTLDLFFSKCTMHGLLNKSFRFHLPIDYTWWFSKRFPNGIYRLAFHNSFWLFLQSSEQTATKILHWCWIYIPLGFCAVLRWYPYTWLSEANSLLAECMSVSASQVLFIVTSWWNQTEFHNKGDKCCATF